MLNIRNFFTQNKFEYYFISFRANIYTYKLLWLLKKYFLKYLDDSLLFKINLVNATKGMQQGIWVLYDTYFLMGN